MSSQQIVDQHLSCNMMSYTGPAFEYEMRNRDAVKKAIDYSKF